MIQKNLMCRSDSTQADLGEAQRGPPFFKTFLYDSNPSNCPENRFIKCPLILSFETLTLLYFASRIRPQCCTLHLLKSEGVGTRPPLSEFSGSAPGQRSYSEIYFSMPFFKTIYYLKVFVKKCFHGILMQFSMAQSLSSLLLAKRITLLFNKNNF